MGFTGETHVIYITLIEVICAFVQKVIVNVTKGFVYLVLENNTRT